MNEWKRAATFLEFLADCNSEASSTVFRKFSKVDCSYVAFEVLLADATPNSECICIVTKKNNSNNTNIIGVACGYAGLRNIQIYILSNMIFIYKKKK